MIRSSMAWESVIRAQINAECLTNELVSVCECEGIILEEADVCNS